jgi:DNA mismatch endonuclease (patch repair protein)
MADVFTKSKRSQVMAAIRSSGNRDTELKLAALFRKYGITGWRRHQPVFGKPDFVFRPQRIAVFVDGCFWHGCPKCYRRPRSNKKFWDAKIARNKTRDRRVNRELRKFVWRVVRIWEHDLAWRSAACVRKIQGLLANYKR